MSITITEAVQKFIAYAKRYDSSAPNTNWYVGITSNDPIIRKKQHEREKGITCEHFQSLVDYPNKSIAEKLESELNEVGFAITTKELMESVSDKEHHVYIYKKGKSK